MRGNAQEVIVVDPAITLIFIPADYAEISRSEILQTTFGVEQPVMVKRDTSYVAEDVNFRRWVIIQIAADGRSELTDRAFSFSTAAA